jgi:hypothetical protein
MTAARFSDFADTILNTDFSRVANASRIPDVFLLAREGRIDAHYIPFDYVNARARVVVVGISPGFVQWKNAMLAAQRGLREGLPLPELLRATNYNGASPNMLTTPLLQAQILDYFALEASATPDAVYVPLGPKVSQALSWLARRGVLDEARILHGIPHPSGANAERIAYFLGRKDKAALSSRTNGNQIDADRLALREKMAALGMASPR